MDVLALAVPHCWLRSPPYLQFKRLNHSSHSPSSVVTGKMSAIRYSHTLTDPLTWIRPARPDNVGISLPRLLINVYVMRVYWLRGVTPQCRCISGHLRRTSRRDVRGKSLRSCAVA